MNEVAIGSLVFRLTSRHSVLAAGDTGDVN